ncbi:MAG: SRPBCC domain-containing protein [Saprospiraceae bacterium]|nr:SRPBCC domain-containing protein [Saprospiraceae bacterium]
MIHVSIKIAAPLDSVWAKYTDPWHILHWNAAIDSWHSTYAENDLREGGKFLTRMEAKDQSMGFDFSGTYTVVMALEKLAYILDDGRSVSVLFSEENGLTEIYTSFDVETVNSEEIQRSGWQAILDNFGRYVLKSANVEQMHFETLIDSSPALVYKMMLEDTHYRAWTSVFNPTSCFRGNWEKGSMMRFMGIDQDGNTGGMVSRIKENLPGKFLSIEHLGVLKGDVEIMEGPEVASWAGGLENYTFQEDGNSCMLKIDMDADPEFKSYFEESWPKALSIFKDICER